MTCTLINTCASASLLIFLEEVNVEELEAATTFNQNGSVPIKSRSEEDKAAEVLDDLRQENTVTMHLSPKEESSL